MAKRKHIGTVILTILVAALLASGVSGWLFWQSVQRVIGEAQQAGEYAAEAQQSVGQGDFKQALEQMDSAGSHIVAARDETQGMLWQAAEYVLYYGSDVKAVRGMLDAAANAFLDSLAERRRAEGLPLGAQTWADLAALAGPAGVAAPAVQSVS